MERMHELMAIMVCRAQWRVNSDISTPKPVPTHRRTMLGAQIQCQPLKIGTQTSCAEGTSACAYRLHTPSQQGKGEPDPSPGK